MEIILINQLRGFAFILMFIYHIFVFLKVLHNNDYLNNYIIKSIGVISRNIFILLIGVSLYLSYIKSKNFNIYKKKQLERSIKIYFISIIITLFTYYTIYDYYIVFGVLHFISVAILLLHQFVNNFYILSIISLVCLYFNSRKYMIYSQYSFINYINSIIGINIYKNSMDHFSLIKWIPYVIYGIFIGYVIVNIIKNKNIKNKKNIKKNKNIKTNIYTDYLSIIGKNTLILYLIHFPLIYFIIKYIYNYIF
tara:strand:+ start:73 stop:825 length:753 start_codon:yes stop_codon:yes gene_type:complete